MVLLKVQFEAIAWNSKFRMDLLSAEDKASIPPPVYVQVEQAFKQLHDEANEQKNLRERERIDNGT